MPRAEPCSVLFVVPRFHTNLAGAVATLQDAGHAVSVFAGATQPLESHDRVVPRVFGPGTRAAEIDAALDAVAPDICFLRRTHPLSTLAQPRLRRRGVRTWRYDQRPLDRPVTPWLWLEDRLKRKLADRVTPVPGFGPRRDARAHLLPWPIVGTPRSGPRPPGPLRVLCVGKLIQPRKNQPLLIEALNATGLPYELTLCGATGRSHASHTDDHLARLRRMAAEAPDRGRINFAEDVPFARMGDIYRAHDLCVLPAHHEVLGNAPLEAMAHGVAPVIARTAGSAGYLAHGRDGWLMDPDDAAGLAALLAPLLEDPARAEATGRAARDTAEARFSPAAFLAAFERLRASRGAT